MFIKECVVLRVNRYINTIKAFYLYVMKTILILRKIVVYGKLPTCIGRISS